MVDEKSIESNKNDNVDKTDILYFIGVAIKYKYFIIITTTVIAIVSILFVLFTTQYYSSTAQLYAMTKNNSGPLKSLITSLGLAGSNNVYIPELLKTRTIAKKVLYKKYQVPTYKDSISLFDYWKFNEKSYSDSRKIDLAIKRLGNSVDVYRDNETDLISVTTTINNGKLAYDVLQAFLDGVSEYLQEEFNSVFQKAGYYTEQRIAEVKQEIKIKEEDLIKFKESNKKIVTASLSHVLREKDREFQLLVNVLNMLEKQRELLLVEEVKERPVINIIDKGDIHDKATKPQKRKVVVFNTFVSFILSFVFALLYEKYFNSETIAYVRKRIQMEK